MTGKDNAAARMFSVVIPLFNRRDVIAATIKSVQQQTFQDFEIIVVDDGSFDNPQEVLQTIAEPRLRLIRQENRGGSAARNTGIDAASGRYVAFLDSDDAFLPHHLEHAARYLVMTPNACTYTQVIVDRGNGVTFLKPCRATRPNEHISDYLMRNGGFVQTSTLIVPRILAVSTRYDEVLTYGQDTDFALKLANNGAQLVMLNIPGAIWKDHGANGRLSSNSNASQRVAWLNRIRPLLTKKAYWGDIGWTIAKSHAREGRLFSGLALYASALVRGTYSPKQAIVILIQIVFPPQLYRIFADRLARLGFAP